MGARSPRQLAEVCFAVARSTTHAGERDAAIGRGLALCTKHGLDPDGFDIPGRAKRTARPRSSGTADRSSGKRAHFVFTDEYFGDDLAEAVACMQRALREAEERAMADALRGETAYEARRRNFDAATRAARERDQIHAHRREACDRVAGYGVRTFRLDTGDWLIEHGGLVYEVNDQGLFDLADRMADVAAEASA